ELITPDAGEEQLFQKQSTVEESFDYVIGLMDEAIPDLAERKSGTLMGQVDQVIAKSIKARVMLFRASPFFNGNQEYFGDFYNEDGDPFFPLDYDKEKWKDAIDAINIAIDACH
ncbi:MAG: RagB/SusD family nutrient uptake outer membrane protein, partial [Bacteroidales bacterium]